ncbi:MAG TPA: hypothetical protein VEG31_01060 [Thermoproteota archaeon]|nr:hypothetical protein [Thermoproteota archaeon]
MKKGRFTAELTEDDGSRVKVTVDAKDPEVSLGRFLTVMRELGAANTSANESAKLPSVEPIAVAEDNLVTRRAEDELSSVMVQGVAQEIGTPWDNGLDSAEGDTRSKMNNVMVLMRSLPRSWFTSKDVKRFYEERFGVRANLTIVSMYLGRLVTRGSLTRAKSGRAFKYKLAESER